MTSAGTIRTAHRGLTATGGRFWSARIAVGLALGAAVAILQADHVATGWTMDFVYYFPEVTASDDPSPRAILSTLLLWCGEGVLMALTVGVAERWSGRREPRAWELALRVVVGAVAAVLIWHALILDVLRDTLGVRLTVFKQGGQVAWIGGVLYHAWLMLFFGGLAAAVAESIRWRARAMAALHAAQLERGRAQRRLASERLASLHARIDPDFVMRTLTEVERLYEEDARAAGQRLEDLVAFLRERLADPHSHASGSEREVREPAEAVGAPTIADDRPEPIPREQAP